MVLHLLTPSTTTVVKIVLNDIRDACSTVDIFNGCSSGPQVWSTCGPEFGNFPHLIPFFLKASLLPNVGGNRSLLNSMSRIVLFNANFMEFHSGTCLCVNLDVWTLITQGSVGGVVSVKQKLIYIRYCIHIVYILYIYVIVTSKLMEFQERDYLILAVSYWALMLPCQSFCYCVLL